MAKKSIQTKIVFIYTVKDISLPASRVSKEEFEQAVKIVTEIRFREPADSDSPQSAWNGFLKEMKENEKVQEFGPWDSKTSDYGWLKPMEPF